MDDQTILVEYFPCLHTPMTNSSFSSIPPFNNYFSSLQIMFGWLSGGSSGGCGGEANKNENKCQGSCQNTKLLFIDPTHAFGRQNFLLAFRFHFSSATKDEVACSPHYLILPLLLLISYDICRI